MSQSVGNGLLHSSRAALAAALLGLLSAAADGRVTKIVIDSTTPLTGQNRAYEQIRGRAFGDLDPSDPHNAIITDLALGKDDDGKVRYETTFLLTKPVDMTQASGFMWHEVPNRGNAYAVAVAERNLGDIVLASGDYSDGTGMPGAMPPAIRHVIPMKVPRVDRDGNELGGVPTVLRDAPLGTYLGWNVTAGGFHEGQVCNYIGGMIPFVVTRAKRTENHDPRLSLTERYGDHAGYVSAVRKAADNAMAQGYLLQSDHDALIAAAEASNVLR